MNYDLERVCIACERGEHGTAWADACVRVMQCDCPCHELGAPVSKESVWTIVAALLAVAVFMFGLWWLASN